MFSSYSHLETLLPCHDAFEIRLPSVDTPVTHMTRLQAAGAADELWVHIYIIINTSCYMPMRRSLASGGTHVDVLGVAT